MVTARLKHKLAIARPRVKAVVKSKVVPATVPPPRAKARKQKGLLEFTETQKQKRLAHLISENIGKSHPLTMEEMMLQAGYAATTARAQPAVIVDAARNHPEVQGTLATLHKHREKLLKQMDATVEKANYAMAAMGLSIVDKSIALMEGRPTERKEVVLGDEERAVLEGILAENE